MAEPNGGSGTPFEIYSGASLGCPQPIYLYFCGYHTLSTLCVTRGRRKMICWRGVLLYDDGPATGRVEPFLVSDDVESPVGVEVGAEV